uniref:Nuclear factor of kappa light polypeptide gene enhancer in B-cells 2 (p49/p100) n=1 Tax=Poecilia reticulata TaxID=8081 RepID=A0A3P9PAP4_POERE
MWQIVPGQNHGPSSQPTFLEPFSNTWNPPVQPVPEPVPEPPVVQWPTRHQRGFRFRYECEGPSHGGLPGASSEKNRRTYPTVKINNYVGHARVEVQLVTHTDPARVHAHSLVGRHCNENGTCSLDIGPNDLTASFSNLGILHVTKKGVVEVLTRRSWSRPIRTSPLSLTSLRVPADGEESSILKEAKELGKVMDLNIVRLRFTAFLQDSNGGFTRALKPVVSNPIYDSNLAHGQDVRIGIRFYEEDEDGCWEAFGDFSPTDVHKQYAIVFKTPPYHSAEIDRPVTVFLQLRRKKAGDSSDPKQFTYVPQVQDKEEVLRKKQKPLPHYDSWRGGRGRDGGPGAGGFGSGPGGPGGAQRDGSEPEPESEHFSFPEWDELRGTFQNPNRKETEPFEGPMLGPGSVLVLVSNGSSLSSSRASQSARQTAAALLQYCSTGDARVLLALQRHLCGIQDANGDTPLHLAIIHQQTAVIQQLVQTLLSTDILTPPTPQTPLHLAVITRQLKVLEVLLRAGADPTLVDKDGRSPLHLAALAGDTATLRLLLAHLGERHAHLVNTPDYHGEGRSLQPLHLAVRRDGERCLRLLVEGGAKINAAELKSGNTPLHLAVRENLFKVACTLITELKAEVNTCTFGGNTPLHLAASLGFPTLCSMLIAAGADKTMENDEPLYFSSSDEEAEPDEPIGSRKRRARGHTPLDLATCQKVRAVAPAAGPKPSHGERSGLDEETLSRLVAVLSVGDVPWVKLAEKLGMMTLTHLYEDSATPCQHLLQHYKLGGGPVEGLVEALQALGLTEGVRLLRNTELRDDKHSSGRSDGSEPKQNQNQTAQNDVQSPGTDLHPVGTQTGSAKEPPAAGLALVALALVALAWVRLALVVLELVELAWVRLAAGGPYPIIMGC